MKAYVGTENGTKVVNITACDAPFSEKELERCQNKFNRDTTVLEWKLGTTYCVAFKGKSKPYRLKSSSLDELFEMYKSAWKGKPIQERKCFFNK